MSADTLLTLSFFIICDEEGAFSREKHENDDEQWENDQTGGTTVL